MSASLPTAVALALLLCSLTAGFLFAFAVVVMPGLSTLDDAAYLRAFQVVDRVIQETQPLFMVVWVGSVLAVLVTLVFGAVALTGLDRLLLVGAALLYLGGVQLPTAAVNVPLNNRVQSLDVGVLGPAALSEARAAFEGRWNRWNARRTVLATASVAMLILALLRL